MKKLFVLKGITIIALSLFFISSINAQGYYVDINVGYAVPMGSDLGLTNSNSDGGSWSREVVPGSLGKGINFSGTFGNMFTKYVGVELGLSYLMGGKNEGESKTDGKRYYYNSYVSNMFRVIPSFIITGGTEGFYPYAKFGVVLGFGSFTNERERIYSESNFDDPFVTVEVNEKTTKKYSGGLAIGIKGAIGAVFELSDGLSLFGELNTVNMGYAPTKSEYTEWTKNGKDELPDKKTSQKEFEFVDSFTYDSDSPPSESEPTKYSKTKYPFGSIGLNAGVRIKL